jgi:hypothetical protein
MPARSRRYIVLAACAAVVALGLAACSKNEPTAPGLDSVILVQSAGPLGEAPPVFGASAWAVNTIDSILFTDDIDSTLLDVTALVVFDPQGQIVPGTVRFAQRRAFIFYTQPFPSAAYDFELKDAPLPPTLGKAYFIPTQPLHGRTEYTVLMSNGIRMTKGTLRREAFAFQFVTGDSVAPPPAAAK